MKISIEEMTEKQAKDLLQKLVDKLDELSRDDYFGTEGWEHFFGFDD